MVKFNSRIIGGICFFSALFGLVIMYFADLSGKNFENIGVNTVVFFSYFTILSNIFVMLATGSFFLKKRRFSVVKESSILLYIVITGSVYFTVLRNVWTPTGWKYLADALLHYSTPVLYVSYWLISSGKEKLNKNFFWKVNVFPLLYLGYTILKGAIYNHYPYPFMQVPKLGYPRVLLNTVIILIVMMILAIPVYLYNNHRYNKNN